MGAAERAERERQKNREALLEAMEALSDVAAAVQGFVSKFVEQGFTDEQAHELAAALLVRALREE